MDTIKRLNKQEHKTIVFITHYMEEATGCDRVFVMEKGKIAFSGTPKEIFSKVEDMRRLHLDIPQSAELCEVLTALGAQMPRGVISTEECARLLYQKITGSAPDGNKGAQ